MERANRRHFPYLPVDVFYSVVFREDSDLAHLCELVDSETVSTNFGYHGILGRGLRAFQDIVLSFLAQEGKETRLYRDP